MNSSKIKTHLHVNQHLTMQNLSFMLHFKLYFFFIFVYLNNKTGLLTLLLRVFIKR